MYFFATRNKMTQQLNKPEATMLNTDIIFWGIINIFWRYMEICTSATGTITNRYYDNRLHILVTEMTEGKIYANKGASLSYILTIDSPSTVRLEHFIKDTNDNNLYCIHVRFKFRILAIQCSRWRRKQWYFLKMNIIEMRDI